MVSIIISSSPVKSSMYEQGIECALNLCESENDVQVLLVGEFLDYLLEHQDSVAFKKLKQLQLFEITTLSAKDNFSFIEKAKIKEILDSSTKQVTF